MNVKRASKHSYINVIISDTRSTLQVSGDRSLTRCMVFWWNRGMPACS